MAKQDNAATRLYKRIHRVEKGADWLYEVTRDNDVAALIMDCHRASLVASRLMQVKLAQQQRGMQFKTPFADVQERVEVLEMRLDTMIHNWVILGLDAKAYEQVATPSVVKKSPPIYCFNCQDNISNPALVGGDLKQEYHWCVDCWKGGGSNFAAREIGRHARVQK